MAGVTARVKLIEGIQMVGESGSGHSLVMDAAPEFGGRNLGVRPMELFLIGMGGCASIDILNILRKGRHQVTDCEVRLDGTRAETEPKVFTAIAVHYRITGRNIPTAALERAIKLSEEKYCSAYAMLSRSATISSSYELVEG